MHCVILWTVFVSVIVPVVSFRFPVGPLDHTRDKRQPWELHDRGGTTRWFSSFVRHNRWHASVPAMRRRREMLCMDSGQGDEGIADLESMDNPAKMTDYGDEHALQYGVSGAATSGSNQFFSVDTRIVFGVNALEIGLVELADMGFKRALIVTGWNQARADPVVWELLPRGFDLAWYSVLAEPCVGDIIEGASLALDHRADCVVAMGGGSVMDAAKVIAAIAYADTDHAKAVARLVQAASEPRQKQEEDETSRLISPIPLITVGMMPGLGAEVTPMASLLVDDDPLDPKKVTLGFHNTAAALPAPFMAVVEPRLTMRIPLEESWPRAFTALAGCLEGFIEGKGFVQDLLSHQALVRISACLSRNLGFRGPLYSEREDIAFAGVIRGLVAPRSGWGFLHRLASATSLICGAPYASCVSRLLPRILELQISRLREEEERIADEVSRRREDKATSSDADGGNPVSTPDDLTITNADQALAKKKPTRPSGQRQRNTATANDTMRGDCTAALLRLGRAAGFVNGEGRSEAEALVTWMDERLLDKNIPRLFDVGFRPEHISWVVDSLGLEEQEVRRRSAKESSGGIGGWYYFDAESIEKILSFEASCLSGDADSSDVHMHDRDVRERRGYTGRRSTATGPWQKR